MSAGNIISYSHHPTHSYPLNVVTSFVVVLRRHRHRCGGFSLVLVGVLVYMAAGDTGDVVMKSRHKLTFAVVKGRSLMASCYKFIK